MIGQCQLNVLQMKWDVYAEQAIIPYAHTPSVPNLKG
jgi:hypothetical protein